MIHSRPGPSDDDDDDDDDDDAGMEEEGAVHSDKAFEA